MQFLTSFIHLNNDRHALMQGIHAGSTNISWHVNDMPCIRHLVSMQDYALVSSVASLMITGHQL